MDENNKVVEDAASPVQVEDGLDLLGHLRKVDVVLEPTPIIIGELVAPCVRAPDLLLRYRFSDQGARLDACEDEGKEDDVHV